MTDMSLGSEASSSKTPGGYEAYHKQKAFNSTTLEEEDHDRTGEDPQQEGQGYSTNGRQTIMKRSVSSTLDEEEEDDDLLEDEDPRHRNSSNNNNEYHNGESSDDMLDTLEGAVGQLWEVKNGNGRRRPGPCRCKCKCRSSGPKVSVSSVGNGRNNIGQLTEEDLEEEEDPSVIPVRPRSDYGRSESNETLDSKDTNSSSREDVFAEDGFETFSDDENITRPDLSDFLKRKS